MIVTSVSFNEFGCFSILKKDLSVYKNKSCSRGCRCCCGSSAVYFLEMTALKYSRSELDLLPEDTSYHKQKPDGRNSDLLRKYGI